MKFFVTLSSRKTPCFTITSFRSFSFTDSQTCAKTTHYCINFLWTFLTFGSSLLSEPTGLTSSVRVCSQLPSLARRRNVSPTKQSSALGSSFLLANGSGWQHQSSTMAFQLPLGRGRTRLNTLKERNIMHSRVFSHQLVVWCTVTFSMCCERS